MAELCNLGWPAGSSLHFSPGSTSLNRDGSHGLILGTPSAYVWIGTLKKINKCENNASLPLETGTSVFGENTNMHPPKGWQTRLHLKMKRCSSEQSNSQPDPPVLYWWWTSQGRWLPLWKAEKAHFPHLYFGGYSSSALQVPKQAYKYYRVSLGKAGKHRHMLQLPNAKQHSIQAKEKTSKGFISSE